jgi:hypothetical protein
VVLQLSSPTVYKLVGYTSAVPPYLSEYVDVLMGVIMRIYSQKLTRDMRIFNMIAFIDIAAK